MQITEPWEEKLICRVVEQDDNKYIREERCIGVFKHIKWRMLDKIKMKYEYMEDDDIYTLESTFQKTILLGPKVYGF